MPKPSCSKKDIRAELRRQRALLSPETRAAAATQMASHISQLPAWPQAQRIAVYLAADCEIDPLPLVELARKAGKEIFLPVIQQDKSLTFSRWQEGDTLVPNRYDIPEPAGNAPTCSPSEVDIVFMPLVAWDRSGTRLGMGAGFYDRTLANAQATLRVGLAYSVQEVAQLPREDWDISLNAVVTEAALVYCQD